MKRVIGLFAGLAILLPALFPSDARAVDSGAWVPLTAASLTPKARFGAAFTIDTVHARIWMFGGYDGSGYLNDVWTRPSDGGATWTQVVPSGTAPSGRINPTWVYDPVGNRLVLFGGANNSGFFNETWELDLSGAPSWSPVAAAGTLPSPRYTHAALYDPPRHRMLVFGGVDNVYLANDCWSLDLTSTPPAWSLLAPAGPPPVARSYPGIIYDPTGDRLVLFGGYGTLAGELMHGLQDTWTLGLAGAGAWTQQSPSGTLPPGRRAHGACYDPAHARMLIIAGFDGTNELGDCWALDLGGGMSWSAVALGAASIAGRSQSGFAFDPATERLIGFGGHQGNKALGDDVELYLRGTYASFAAPGGPSPRLAHKAAYDPVGGDMYVFGGTPLGTSLNDVYRLHLDLVPSWSLLLPAGPAPAPRQEHAEVFDPGGRRLVVYGGRTFPSTCLADVWQLDVSATPSWSPVPTSGSPAGPRRGAAATYDPVGKRMIVFGGLDNFDARLNDLRALTLQGPATWSVLPAVFSNTPSPRYSASLIDDPVRNRVILFGGTADEFTFFNEVWAYDLSGATQWTRLSPSGGGPGGREAHEAVYDPARDRMVVLGGYDGSFRNDAWELTLADPPAWHLLLPSGAAPAARDFFASVSDPVYDRLVLFGGNEWNGSSALPANDTWLLNWSELPVPVLVSLTDASVEPGTAHLRWFTTDGAGVSATVERTEDGTTFASRATVVSDGSGNLVFDDAVEAAGRYGYRLVVGPAQNLTEITWLEVPASAVRMHLAGAWPNPARTAPTLSFALASRAGPAVLEVFDVAGRRVFMRDVAAFGPGAHALDLRGAFPARAGVYLATLRVGGATSTRKFAILP